jgi:hypothetical protein
MRTSSGPTRVLDRPTAVADSLHAGDLPVPPWERDLRAAVDASRARRRRIRTSPDRPGERERERERPSGHTR